VIGNGKGNGGPCPTLPFVLGIGAEAKNTPTTFGEGFGLYSDDTDTWSGNIHVINTINQKGSLPAVESIKTCIECNCPFGGGGVSCCPDGGTCAGINPEVVKQPGGDRTFYLQYAVTYTSQSAVKPVQVAVLDTTNCNVEYNVPSLCPWWTQHIELNPVLPVSWQNKPKLGLDYPWEMEGDDCTHTLTSTLELPAGFEGNLTTAVGHQHIGGVNVSLYLQPADGSRTKLCTSVASYGTTLDLTGQGLDAGDELGYLVSMSRCDFGKAPVVLKGGDSLVTESVYQASVPRAGVMGYFIVSWSTKDTSVNTFVAEKGRQPALKPNLFKLATS